MLNVFIRLFVTIVLFSNLMLELSAVDEKQEIATQEQLAQVLNNGDVQDAVIENLKLTQEIKLKYFNRVDFHRCELNLEFIAASLSQVNFQETTLENVYFRESNVQSDVNFAGALLKNVYFVGSHISDVDLSKINPESIILIDETTMVDGIQFPDDVNLQLYSAGKKSKLDAEETREYFKKKGMRFVTNLRDKESAKRVKRTRREKFPKKISQQDLIDISEPDHRDSKESPRELFVETPELEVDSEDETRVIATRSKKSLLQKIRTIKLW